MCAVDRAVPLGQVEAEHPPKVLTEVEPDRNVCPVPRRSDCAALKREPKLDCLVEPDRAAALDVAGSLRDAPRMGRECTTASVERD